MQLDRNARNLDFIERMKRRSPEDAARYVAQMVPQAEAVGIGGAPGDGGFDPVTLETIVMRSRPVFSVEGTAINFDDALVDAPEARLLRDALRDRLPKLAPLLPLVGRIDVENFASNVDYVGTGWFIDTDIVVTNRHVASLIARWDGRRYAFMPGIGTSQVAAALCTAHDRDFDAARRFEVIEVVYIEPVTSAVDIAFLRVQRESDGTTPQRIEIAASDASPEQQLAVIGYPARASQAQIPDQSLMQELYRGQYDIKRIAPGYAMVAAGGVTRHDCTTLGGNSGSVVIDPATGAALGLHFAGLYQETNYAVRASLLADYVARRRWATPVAEVAVPPAPDPAPDAPAVAGPGDTAPITASAGAAGSISFTVPITITVSLGGAATAAVATTPAVGAPSPTIAAVEAAAADYWNRRPEGVVACRVGFDDADAPFLAVSALPSRLAALSAAAPATHLGARLGFFAADASEQREAFGASEAATSISYDDDARTGPGFAFDPVDEVMKLTLHVGPEYSWEVLQDFLAAPTPRLESAMYEFHADHIRAALEARLVAGTSLQLVLDNATYAKGVVQPGNFGDRDKVIGGWLTRFAGKFTTIVAPEGATGLIANAYHIKVTVRDDNNFWLSSGNWKAESSQPIITQAQRDNALNVDLPGNREWHVVAHSKRLAGVFRNHIAQDFKRSQALGGTPLPGNREAPELFIELPGVVEAVEERPPPRAVLAPVTLNKRVKVRPLLTPDRQGAVFSEAVLELIGSARHSLVFQIPYIGMAPSPGANRGFIDALIAALADKLRTLPDARLILRNQGAGLSSPTHAAWFFRSKGVDITKRVRQLENTHTKGMVVDGVRCLIGSHNWSQAGVTLNRDASLLFDSADVAGYFAKAFEIDWARASKITPRQFVRSPGRLTEAPDFRRVALADIDWD